MHHIKLVTLERFSYLQEETNGQKFAQKRALFIIKHNKQLSRTRKETQWGIVVVEKYQSVLLVFF